MTPLVKFKSGVFTPDTVKGLRQLEDRALKTGYGIRIDGPAPDRMYWKAIKEKPGPTGLRPEWSAVPTGREVYAALAFKEDQGPSENRAERQLAALWGLMVPLGFIPWTRYPLAGPGDQVFHYYGPWAILFDHLLGAGRGEAAWPGFCAAAQIEVGKWEGPRKLERQVQAHMHRMGFNPGVIDGIVARKTQGALKASGLHSMPMREVAEKVIEKAAYIPAQYTERKGQLQMPDGSFSINSFGQVRTTRTVEGATLLIKGAGRVVVDVHPPEP